MSSGVKRGKNAEICRICSKSGLNLRHLFHDEALKREILPKIHTVFPHILIYENDPLPKGICEGCELFIYATHEKLVEFNKAQQGFVAEDVDTEYLRGYKLIQTLLERIEDIKNDVSSKAIVTRQLPKSLKRICIDYFNEHGPTMVNTYLKCGKGVRKKSYKQIYKSFGGRKRKRNRHQEKPKTKIKPKSPVVVADETTSNASNEEGSGPATRRRSRAVSRVNYVDDIPDSVLFFDEIQAAKRRKLEEKVILESIKEASKHPNPEIFQTNPQSEIQINAAISIPMMEVVNSQSECHFCGTLCDNLKELAMHNLKHLSLRIRRLGEKLSLPANLRRGVMFREDRYRVIRCTSCLNTFRNAEQIKEHWNTANCEFYCKICYESFNWRPEALEEHLYRHHGIRKRKQIPEVYENEEPQDILRIKTEEEEPPSPLPPPPPPATNGFLKVKSVSMINASAPLLEAPPPSEPFPEHFPSFPAQGLYQNPMMLQGQRAVCLICHCSFPNINSRNSHMKAHKRLPEMTPSMSRMPPPFVANFSNASLTPCGFIYYNRAEFLQHRSECKDCRYACMVCSKPFQSGSELQMHMMLTHPRSLTFKR